MPYQDFDLDLNRERRVQIRREVEHNRLKATRSGKGAGPEEAVSLTNLATRSAAVVVSLFR